jgi:hypothetical protein
LYDPRTVGPDNADIQIRPRAVGGCNSCLPATGHITMNVAMANGSVRTLTGDLDRRAFWALLTPASED